jgi:hypothetical protein
MFGVGGRKERTLMMVKPPCQAWRTRVLEIHDGIFVAVKQPLGEWLPRAVRHAGEVELRAGPDAFAKETIEDCRRRRSIEAVVVKTQTNIDSIRHCPHSPPCHSRKRGDICKAIKDGRAREECQDEKGEPSHFEKFPLFGHAV